MVDNRHICNKVNENYRKAKKAEVPCAKCWNAYHYINYSLQVKYRCGKYGAITNRSFTCDGAALNTDRNLEILKRVEEKYKKFRDED